MAKSFAATTVLHDINLEIRDGEFFTLLGPSGSGKTTLLRMAAGFETLDRGRSHCTAWTPTSAAHVRPVNTVVQDYALFPHRDAVTNVEYRRCVGGVKREERRRRPDAALAMVRLGPESRLVLAPPTRSSITERSRKPCGPAAD